MGLTLRRVKDILFENWYLKLFSLVLATGLWALIAQESTSEVFFEVPVEYQNVPPRTEVIGEAARRLEVRLRGPSTLIREIAAKDISAIIDLGQKPKDGESLVPRIHTPFGVDVVRVTPSRVHVSLEPTVSVMVHVVMPPPTGHPAPGYETVAVAVNPESVNAEGPASHVQNLTSVMTTPVDLTNKKSSFNQVLDLDFPDSLVRFPENTPVRAEIKIRKKS